MNVSDHVEAWLCLIDEFRRDGHKLHENEIDQDIDDGRRDFSG